MDAAGSTIVPKLSMSRRRRRIVIALLPSLEAERDIIHLDKEDPAPAHQLEADDERRSQPVEAGKIPPSAENLCPPVGFVAFLDDNNPGAHLPRTLVLGICPRGNVQEFSRLTQYKMMVGGYVSVRYELFIGLKHIRTMCLYLTICDPSSWLEERVK